MNFILEELFHYGMPKRSGRYPWGSGKDPYQHSGDFLSRVDELRKKNFEFTDENGRTYTGDLAIAKSMGLTSTQFRTQISLANNERRALDVDRAKSLRADGNSLREIGRIMGVNESTVRSLLNANSEARMNQAMATADFLKKMIDEKGMIDVGAGVELQLGISREKLTEALYILEMEGYPIYGGGVPQATNPGRQTNIKVICPPGTAHKEIYDFNNVHSITDFTSHDDGESFDPKFKYPASMDSKRIKIRYGDEGGEDFDGLIELRRGVQDLDMGNSLYSQVRILVDGTHYVKGMAVYNDDLPPGVDLVFNTNKHSGTPALGPKGNTVLKLISKDPDNPFGSLIKEDGGQSYYYDKNGKKHLSLINKRAEEGDWDDWADKMPSQFLAKQPMKLIQKQLNLAYADKRAEYDEICSLTNPTVKKVLLSKFADECDSAAVHLQAASLPRQKYQVILPLKSIKDNEVYAPNFDDGETVALIRFPHGGTFEIPVLKVNNKNSEGARIMGKNPKDAVGINSKVAKQLSGADFDGDTVMVIPCNSSKSKVNIVHKPYFKELEDFDPKMEYGGKKEGTFKRMNNTQKEMGVISNLITDMTIKGAPDKEIIRAVKHSMVVIDAEKHGLDYKQSEKDNGIAALKKTYQGHTDKNGKYHEGASTLISRAKSEQTVPKRRGSPIIKDDGSVEYKTATDLYYVNKKGKTVMRTQKSTKMAEAKDARSLSSGTPKEEVYAEYANKQKALAKEARRTMLNTKDIPYSASAKATYSEEVKTLNAKVNVAMLNKPKERQAQLMTNSIVAAKKKENPDLSKKEVKKISQQTLTASRIKVGAKRTPVEVTDREWEAIQAGAISKTQLEKIINNMDDNKLKERATPRTSKQLSDAKKAKIRAMKASGYTNKEIADAVGVSSSTISKQS